MWAGRQRHGGLLMDAGAYSTKTVHISPVSAGVGGVSDWKVVWFGVRFLPVTTASAVRWTGCWRRIVPCWTPWNWIARYGCDLLLGSNSAGRASIHAAGFTSELLASLAIAGRNVLDWFSPLCPLESRRTFALLATRTLRLSGVLRVNGDILDVMRLIHEYRRITWSLFQVSKLQG